MRLILVRHGESLGNIDESAFCRVPDHAMELTPAGVDQSVAAGALLRTLIDGRPIEIFVSPYKRTLQTLELLALDGPIQILRQEPRLREQDWGNLQDPKFQVRQRVERNYFGHFFYRLRNGESGADVYDRVSGFLAALFDNAGIGTADLDHLGGERTVILITHGLTMRLLCMSLMGWTVEEFEALSNPVNGDFRVLDQDSHGNWSLDRPFDTWQ